MSAAFTLKGGSGDVRLSSVRLA